MGNTPQEQLKLVETTASAIVDLEEDGYDVVVGHGNGPQVGMVNLAFEYSANNGGKAPLMPFPECGAMTQGYIGYHLQQAIQREHGRRRVPRPCAAILTQVVVDEKDPAFQKPTKPVGMFYGKNEAEQIAATTGYTFVEDAGRGWRRVVPSPHPVRIVELPVVRRLLDQHTTVITVGGGGIPVIENAHDDFSGVAAVIDKDRACSKLATDLKADMLVILTAVDKVSINFNQPNQYDLDKMTIEEAKQFIAEGQFAPGSMLPKVESCVDFVTNNPHGVALITSLEKAREALWGKTGTMIVSR